MQQRGRTASSSTSSSAYRFRGSSGQQGGEAENSPRSDRTQVSRLHELRYGTGSSQEVGGEAAEGALKNIISGSADVTGANAGSTTQIQTSEIVQGHSSGGTSVSRKQQYFYSYSSQQQQSTAAQSASSNQQQQSSGYQRRDLFQWDGDGGNHIRREFRLAFARNVLLGQEQFQNGTT